MAITPALSRRLYETLGAEAANDMVGWMQGVEAHRAELRELNELNFSRFNARFAEFEARFGEFEARFGQVDARLGELEARLARTDADIRREMELGFARLEIKIEQRAADIMKWSFVFWVGAVLALAGALAALVRFLT